MDTRSTKDWWIDLDIQLYKYKMYYADLLEDIY